MKKAVKRAGTCLLAAGCCIAFCACGDGQNQEALEMSSLGDYGTSRQTTGGQESQAGGSQTEGGQTGQNGGKGAGSNRDDSETSEALESLLASWTSGQAGEVTLAQVQETFDREGILYTGFCSVSGEWVNMILENGTTLPFREKTAQEHANDVICCEV